MFAASFVLAILAAPFAAAAPTDVYAPPITYPTATTVWKVGHSYNVTWDVSSPPSQISNPIGSIDLVKDNRIVMGTPLATGFSILDGIHEITVPDVAPGNDYAIVLFGDSGDVSQQFTIVA
ncbi:hypothetical protein GLOTRDRAFT_46429 [Gloeophyllum trabeum ATCC 11539]|uniref:Yeast cell wall synthesis Kre9/Knh1-like N-terminal domain-containing protein n=1 Tax=Gloeophyllum trabeum (strain ATCC 11539 / FP-39264 / Madison 617) TaxID=670483 RepID=S7PZA5_GLOTA|nr:uncharacterized protein GLOTRDRAFT_46429 [Gloeophyllum trabeum ATCC 11539]EPQ52813.1 hypothetical protein GLOTRDRAFT_46429 [Gloeophyllum trabeum ATCC 11539]